MTCFKPLTNFINWCCTEYTSPWARIKLTTLMATLDFFDMWQLTHIFFFWPNIYKKTAWCTTLCGENAVHFLCTPKWRVRGCTCTLLPSFLGVHPNFWGCNVPSNSSFGGTKKMNCIFSTQGRAPCCFFVNIRPKKKWAISAINKHSKSMFVW
jgi:hypothetical protein